MLHASPPQAVSGNGKTLLTDTDQVHPPPENAFFISVTTTVILVTAVFGLVQIFTSSEKQQYVIFNCSICNRDRYIRFGKHLYVFKLSHFKTMGTAIIRKCSDCFPKTWSSLFWDFCPAFFISNFHTQRKFHSNWNDCNVSPVSNNRHSRITGRSCQ